MAQRIKFPLKMADGAGVKTIEELREHFDLTSVLGYYDNGRLNNWLMSRYYNEEAEKIRALDASSVDFKKDLCEILGVSYSEKETDLVNLVDVSKKNKRLEELRKYTADDQILASVDQVAFTQEELKDLLDKGTKEIYLCGRDFVVPCDAGDVTYVGVNNPMVKFDDGIIAQGIDLQRVKFNIDEYLDDINDKDFEYFFDRNRILGVKLLHMSAEQGSAVAQYELGICYEEGYGTEKNIEEATKWYQEAAKKGYVDMQYRSDKCYWNENEVGQNYKETFRWYRKTARRGCVESQYKLGECYWNGNGIDQNYQEAFKWYQKAAEQGYAKAQYSLGVCYESGHGVNQNYQEAFKWYQKAASQGHLDAQYELGLCYED